jgi:FtsP/CotA-like multicopper oxidase with cupredoxin domain
MLSKLAPPFVILAASAVLTGCFGSTGEHQGGHRTRTYYIAADEVPWNYASSGRNQLSAEAFDEDAQVFVKRGPDRIGSTYVKALYRAYTDASFKTLKPRPPSEQHLGDLGPIIRAEVGDTVKVVFRNNTEFPQSMHPHGLRYTKANEGAPYNDGARASAKPGASVAPHQTYTYTWRVPERAGPAHGDPSSVMWMYHSHVDEVSDTYAGLIGPIVVTRAGEARPDGRPKDVDQEFFANFMVADENQSPYLDRNVRKYAGRPSSVDPEDEAFRESNLMHSINGYVYGSQPMMRMRKGEHVRWYVMGMGTEVDLHTPHWHGNVVTTGHGMRTDVLSLLPADMMTVDMRPDTSGTWLFHCHVADHITAGMQTRYLVE